MPHVTFINGEPITVPDLGALFVTDAALRMQQSHGERMRELRGDMDALGDRIAAALRRERRS